MASVVLDPSDVDEYVKSLQAGTVLGITDFHALCLIASVDDVKDAINLSDVNECDSDWNNAVFYAAAGRNAPVLEYLLDLGMTDPLYPNAFGLSLVELIRRTLPDFPARRSFYGAMSQTPSRPSRPLNSTQRIDSYLDVSGPVPDYVTPKYAYDVYRIIQEDDVIGFEDRFADYSDDVLLIACQANSPNIASFCIQKRFGLSHISTEQTTAFTYACYNNATPVIDLLINAMEKSVLLMPDNHMKTAESYTVGHENVRLRLKQKREDELRESFRFFTENEFEFLKFDEDAKGTYGGARPVIHRPTGTKMIIKMYHECEGEFITQSTMKEIVINRYLNTVNPNVAVKIYGLVAIGECVHLVLEALEYTIEEYYGVLKTMVRSERLVEYKRILFNLFTNVNILCEAGILHNDLSAKNIMLDSNKRLRLIDFGLAEWWGLSPTRTTVESGVMISSLKGPEVAGSPMYPNPFFVRDTRKTVTSDVFSIGVVFMSLLEFGYLTWTTFVYHGNHFYEYDTKEPKRGERAPKAVLFDTGYVRELDPLLEDLLKHCLNSNPEIRWTAKELLEHEFFTGRPYSPVRSTIAFPKFKNYWRASYNGVNKELLYTNELHNTMRFRKLPAFEWPSERTTTELCINDVLGWIEERYISFDDLVNYVPRFLVIADTLTARSLEEYSAVAFLLTSFVFDCTEEDGLGYAVAFKDVARLSGISKDELVGTSQEVMLGTDVCLSFCPVVTSIAYLVTELQARDALVPTDAVELGIRLKRSLFNWVMESHPVNPPVWEIIVAAYYSGPVFGEYWERNEELIDEVRRTDSIVHGRIDQDSLKLYLETGL